MNSPTRKTITALTLAGAGLLASTSSQAALINYDFMVTIDTATSALFNQSFSGSFSYDDADVPMPGFNGEDLYALQSFTFDFAGTIYGLGDLAYGDAALLGGFLLGLDAGALDFAFLPVNDPFPASFAYDFGTGESGNGSITFTGAASVPEPASALLFGTALLALHRTRTQRQG